MLTKEGKEGRHWLSLHFLHFHLSLERLGVCSFRIISYHVALPMGPEAGPWHPRISISSNMSKTSYRPGWAQLGPSSPKIEDRLKRSQHSTVFVHCIAHGTAHGRKSTPRICLLPRFSKIQNCAFLKLCGSHIYPAWKHGPNRAGRSGSSGSSGSGSGQFVKFKLRRSQDTTSEVFSSIRHPRFSVCQALIGILGKWRCRRCRQHQ